jgi:DNA/RNA endonuclease YhcR with UshA esterase domain
MTRKFFYSSFILCLTFILAQPLNGQSNSAELSPNTANATSPQGINTIWDIQANFDLMASSGANGNAGVEFDGTYFYVTRWASNLIIKLDQSGNQVEQFSIPGVTGLRDLAFDGTYMYGGAAGNTIYQMDFVSKTLVGTISSPVAVRFIAYDSDNDAFWCGTWSDPPTLVSRSGASLASITTGLSGQYGAAYDNVSAGGPYLWVFDQGGGTCPGSLMLYQYNIASGTATGLNHDACSDAGIDGIAGGMFTTSDFVSGTFSIGIEIQSNTTTDGDRLVVYELTSSGGGVTPISTAVEDLNNDFVPDNLGDTLTVQGVVISPNYQTNNISYFIDDGTAGIDLFHSGSTTPVLNLGDEVTVTGVISQYNGLNEIIPAAESDITVVSSGNPVPSPMVVTISQYLSNAEFYENRLVGFINVTKSSGTWPAAGSGGTIYVHDNGSDSLKVYIDSDTDIDGQPEPSWPRDIIAVGSQYTTSVPPNNGYEVTPRYYNTDFLPPNSLPVELTSFTATANLNTVLLDWNTATEVNNHGFEIQRSTGNGFVTVAFVQGHGTTTQPQNYSYLDQNVEPGHYFYRLKQMDFQGTFMYSTETSVDVYPATYSIEQNYPNPFNPSTIINFNLKIDSRVTLSVYNILGQKVTQLVNGNLTAGNHQVNFDASRLSSGIYLYRIQATGIDGSKFSAVKKMMLTK